MEPKILIFTIILGVLNGALAAKDDFYENCQDHGTKVCGGIGNVTTTGEPQNCIQDQSCIFAGAVSESPEVPNDFKLRFIYKVQNAYNYRPCIANFLLLDLFEEDSTGTLRCKDEVRTTDLLHSVYINKTVTCQNPSRRCIQTGSCTHSGSSTTSVSKHSLEQTCIEALRDNAFYEVNGKKLILHYNLSRTGPCDEVLNGSHNWTAVLQEMKPNVPNGKFYTNFESLSEIRCP